MTLFNVKSESRPRSLLVNGIRSFAAEAAMTKEGIMTELDDANETSFICEELEACCNAPVKG